MKKLLRLLLLCTICLVLLLGTDSFSIATSTNAEASKTVFSFAQSEPGIARITLFGCPMTWDLTPLLSLREAIGAFAADIPSKIAQAICSFFVSVFDVFA